MDVYMTILKRIAVLDACMTEMRITALLNDV